jgi:hypothetical protein
MSQISFESQPCYAPQGRPPQFPLVRGLFRMIAFVLIRIPCSLFRGRLTLVSGIQMVLLALPALMCSALLTLPSMLFQSPHHRAYYYFSQSIEADPARWYALGLATVCALIALAIPATDNSGTRS